MKFNMMFDEVVKGFLILTLKLGLTCIDLSTLFSVVLPTVTPVFPGAVSQSSLGELNFMIV